MNARAPQWAAVVVNYEAGPLLLACVRSLYADDTAGTPEVVVVDNGSSDGSLEAVRRELPAVRVVEPGANLGYAGAANRGIAATTAPVVAVCNPDLEVRRGTAAAMVERLRAEADLAALGPMIRNPDGTQYPSARAHAATMDALGHAVLGRPWPRNRFTRRYRQLDADWERPRDVDWVSGAVVFLRRTAIESVGGWDERYFMYVEDVDLCWRLRRLGWRVGYDPAGQAVHVQGASTTAHPYRMIVEHHRSVYRFASRRWHGLRRWLLAPTAVFLAVRALLDVAARALRTRPEPPKVSG
jgi:N-acetylglucosaminyl-diphospho-decaprenol L-rhamnosyltransferase